MFRFFFRVFCRHRGFFRCVCLSGYLDDGSFPGDGSRFQTDPAGADAFGQFSQRRLADGMADSEDDLFIDVVRQGADVVLDAFVVDDAMDGLIHELAIIAVAQGYAAYLDGLRFGYVRVDALLQVFAGSAFDAQDQGIAIPVHRTAAEVDRH